MAALTFDTLKFARRLKDAGMDPRLAEEQAETIAEALQVNLENLATKQDLELLEQRLTIKLGAMLVVAVGIVATLVKIL
ncbi:hypothetical protein [Tepidimonas taiwanensis]|uniref:hypothetical protein n=1 Tax=Tepidimonas taiwanensis TaxID=307486 RepID=UPI0005BDEF9F|nr:hypothetical protein [Tepidimonas taiwanensis]